MAYGVQPTVVGSGIAGMGRTFTAELWDNVDPAAIARFPSLGHFFQDMFICPPTFAANSVAGSVFGNYNGLTNATAGTIIGGAGLQGGGVKLECTTAGEGAYLQLGAVLGRPIVFSVAAEDDTWPYHHPARVRYEARFMLNTVAAATQAMFIGFAGVLASDDLADTTGDVADSKSFFGFHTMGDASNSTLRLIYQSASNTAPVVLNASVATLVANTWYTVGFDFDPSGNRRPSERCQFWFGGSKLSTFLTHAQAATLPTVATTGFPGSSDSQQVFLSPTFMQKSVGAGDYHIIVSGHRLFNEPIVAQGNEACG